MKTGTSGFVRNNHFHPLGIHLHEAEEGRFAEQSDNVFGKMVLARDRSSTTTTLHPAMENQSIQMTQSDTGGGSQKLLISQASAWSGREQRATIAPCHIAIQLADYHRLPPTHLKAASSLASFPRLKSSRLKATTSSGAQPFPSWDSLSASRIWA